jgi:hypothetical protein
MSELSAIIIRCIVFPLMLCPSLGNIHHDPNEAKKELRVRRNAKSAGRLKATRAFHMSERLIGSQTSSETAGTSAGTVSAMKVILSSDTTYFKSMPHSSASRTV